MSNDYYSAATIARQSQARSSNINSERAAVEAAFELLPDRLPLLQSRVNFYTAGGTGDALTVAMSPTLLSYVVGLRISVLLTATNTGAASLNVDGLGARSIKLVTGDDPEVNELMTGGIVDLVFDGTNFLIISPTNSLVSGIANINNPITFGDTVDVTNGPLSVVGNSAGTIVARVKAEDGSKAGVQFYDNDNTAYRDVLVNNGGDTLQLGHSGWAGQTILGDWTAGGTLTMSAVDINGGSIDGTVIGANSAAAATFTNMTAATVDINGGSVDGATIGATSASTGQFTSVTATTGIIDTISSNVAFTGSPDFSGIGNKSSVRSALGLAIGSAVQAYNATLQAIATAGEVLTAQIANGAVTAAKLASNAVTTVKIADAAVTVAKLAAKTGTGTDVVTGTAGSTDQLAKWNASGNAVSVAGSVDVQAEAAWETGTSTDEGLVSPAKVKAAIDALASQSIWATIAAGVGPSVTAGSGIASVVRDAAGLYTITFSSAFSNTNYAIFGVVGGTGGGATVNRYTINVVGDGTGGQEKTTTTVQVYIVNPGNGAAVDPNEFYIQAIGS